MDHEIQFIFITEDDQNLLISQICFTNLELLL